MPYKIYSYKGKYRVCKPGGKKCFSKKGLPKAKAEAQQKALYASENVKESLDTSKVGSNLEFKMVMPPLQDEKKCSVFYKVLSDPGADLVIVYSIGNIAEDTDYLYFAVVDHNDPHSKPHIEEDPLSESAKSLLKTYKLTPADVEMAGDDGYEKIEEHLFSSSETLKEPFEESKSFEAFAKRVLAE
jgi:hypothetical protein